MIYNDIFGMLFIIDYVIVGCTCPKVAIFISANCSKLLVTGTSFWISKEVFPIWCWTCMMKLSSTCTRFVLKLEIFVLVLVTWLCSIILSPSTLQFVLVRQRAFPKGRIFLNINLKNFLRLFLWAFNFN